MKISTETKVGILTILAITALVLGFDFLKGNNAFERGRTFYVVYERTPGLQESDPVRINGVMIGRVRTLELRDDLSILAQVNITEPIDIPVGTEAVIAASDLLGAKQIELAFGRGPGLMSSGDTLKGRLKVGLQEEIRAELAPMTERIQELIAQVDSSVVVISSIFGGSTPRNAERSFLSLAQTMDNLEQASLSITRTVRAQESALDSIFDNLQQITHGFKDNQENIDRILFNLADITDSVAALRLGTTVENANQAIRELTEVIAPIHNGQGTLGKLLVDDSLYENLNASSAQLDELLRDIQANPGRYVTLLRIGGGRKER